MNDCIYVCLHLSKYLCVGIQVCVFKYVGSIKFIFEIHMLLQLIEININIPNMAVKETCFRCNKEFHIMDSLVKLISLYAKINAHVPLVVKIV